ncbi:hypothetical protein BKA70DRAFT_1085940, partial [Coprinopsis sp. MPI-PUGE-AT-0042]
NYLLGLYQGLVKYQGINMERLDQWRRQGILLTETKKVFEAIPAEDRGDYYPWLLRNEYVLDRSQPIPSFKLEDVVHGIIRSGWNYATNGRPTSDDAIHDTIASWPPRKHDCVILCGMLIHSYPPPPDLTLWLRFGFCVGGQLSKMAIVEMYKLLIHSMSFDEFYQVYEDAQLVELLKRKGLTQSAAYTQIADEFEDVVSGSARGVLKSAWYLKVFIQQNPNPLRPGEGVHIEKSVYVDYGWMNCKDTQQINQLLGLYQRYFDNPAASCLNLHSACIEGKLVECLENCSNVTLSQQCKRLLKNFYPLP